jgi:hypothetical protein
MFIANYVLLYVLIEVLVEAYQGWRKWRNMKELRIRNNTYIVELCIFWCYQNFNIS